METVPSSTNASDIVCDDPKYSNDKTGIKFKKCTDCLQMSRASRESETDVAWLLCKFSSANLYDFNDQQLDKTTLGTR